MNEVRHGVIHGKMILLDDDPGMGDGLSVQVIVQPKPSDKPWGEALRRCAGAMADDPEYDSIAAEVQRQRKEATFREVGR